ncbi:MAG: PAS domain S-box protein, partial [Candidatus Poseidoniia archaeon]
MTRKSRRDAADTPDQDVIAVPLVEAESQIAAICAIAADAIIALDHKHRIIQFNDGATAIFGYGRDELLGRDLSTLVPERFRQAHAAHIEAFAASGVASRRMGEINAAYDAVAHHRLQKGEQSQPKQSRRPRPQKARAPKPAPSCAQRSRTAKTRSNDSSKRTEQASKTTPNAPLPKRRTYRSPQEQRLVDAACAVFEETRRKLSAASRQPKPSAGSRLETPCSTAPRPRPAAMIATTCTAQLATTCIH